MMRGFLTRHIFGLGTQTSILTPFRAAIKVRESTRFPRYVRACSPCFIPLSIFQWPSERSYYMTTY